MISVVLDRGKYRIPVEKGLKILKKKMLKEKTLRELRDRQYFMSKGRKAYLARSHRKYVNEQEQLASKSSN